MAIIDGVANYLSAVSYNNTNATTSTKQTEEVTEDTSISSTGGIVSNFDTVEISAAGQAYQSQSENQGNSSGGSDTQEGSGEVKGKRPPPPPPPPKEAETAEEVTTEEDLLDTLLAVEEDEEDDTGAELFELLMQLS